MCILDGAGQPVWPYCGTCCTHPSLALAAHSATIYSPPYNLASPFPVETCTNSVPTALIRLAFPQTHSDHHFAFSVRRCVSKSGTGPASPLQKIVVNLRVLGIMADSGILLRHVRASCPGAGTAEDTADTFHRSVSVYSPNTAAMHSGTSWRATARSGVT